MTRNVRLIAYRGYEIERLRDGKLSRYRIRLDQFPEVPASFLPGEDWHCPNLQVTKAVVRYLMELQGTHDGRTPPKA